MSFKDNFIQYGIDNGHIKPKTKKNKVPNGWPIDKPWNENEAKKAMEAATGLSRDDFSDDGADLIEFQELSELN